VTFTKGGPCYKFNPVWTKELDARLLDMIGSKSYAQMAKALGKSVDALRKRAKALGHPLDQGTTTLRELSRETGYDRHQLRRAGDALNQHWKRATNRKLLITTEQAIALVDYLAADRWKGRTRKRRAAHEKQDGKK
jgi:hypothetical protein